MAGWKNHKGQMVHLPLDNVDTDQLIPARFMSVPRSDGYGPYLMHDLRRGVDDALLADFPLNDAQGASILIAGRNFGTGSSREAAVYALVDAGFRAVIAPSFGDIFAGNAVNNGLLPAVLPQQEIAKIVNGPNGQKTARIDLETGTLSVGNLRINLGLDDARRQKLINGWDGIDLTLQEAPAIFSYRQQRASQNWLWPKA